MKIPTLKLSTGSTIPQIGFGSWQITGNDCLVAISAAFQAGYRHIDTASFYRNEREVGQTIKASGLERSEIFITSKAFPTEYMNVAAAINGSLQRLDTPYLDLYLIHWPPPIGVGEGMWKQFASFREQGLTKNIGVSNYDAAKLQRLMSKTDVVPTVNQVHINPWHYPRETIEFCQAHNITVEAYSPLAHGHNLGDPRLAKIAGGYGKSPAQVLIRWNIQHGWVSLPKSATPERIVENINVFDFELSSADMVALDGFTKS